LSIGHKELDARLKVVGWMEAALVSSSYVVPDDDGDGSTVSVRPAAAAAAVSK
jgi:hypothetical protein